MRIALIHAVRVAMQPVDDAFARHWPQAERLSLLDDALSVDRERASALTPELWGRISALANYGVSAGASGILYTCSAFGDAIDAVKQRLRMPVLKPNEAMFAQALEHGPRLGLLATFSASIESMSRELRSLSPQVELETACVPQALAALQAGDGHTHDALLAAMAPRFSGCDALMLAQFSTARARDAVAAAVDCPVLASPDSAVLRMRELLA
jgi:Asp/Glu/hydantoin racemase